MQNLNYHENTYGSQFYVFWRALAGVVEMDTGYGSQQRHHAGADKETTINVSYAPNVMSNFPDVDIHWKIPITD